MLVERNDLSLRSSERGLKSNAKDVDDLKNSVAPFVGAWIEIRET